MREPAWNKRISICSFSHAAILNVWSSHCPLAISPRQRRTRNHQPVPTLTLKLTRKDDAGAGIMLQSSIRSAALLVLAAGMAATSATAKPPGAPPAAHPAPAPHPAAAPRAAPAPHAAPAARAAAPHIAAPRVAPQAPRAAAPRVTTAPRAAPPAHRVAPQQLARPSGAPHRPPPQDVGRQDMGQRSGRSSLRRQRNGWEVEAGQVLPSPRCANVRDDSPKSPRNSPRNRRPRSRRQHPLVSRRARADRASRPRQCNRQPPTEPLQAASCAMRL